MAERQGTRSTDGPSDPFFETIFDGEWNACVGIQGSPENYADGYIEAALELASAVIDKGLVASRDTLAMPILYNCRHGLELSLKYAIDRLKATGLLSRGHPANHDILGHWQLLQEAKLGDASLRVSVEELEPFVRSLAAIDDDGQELRYAVNRGGEQSLSGIALVNLPHIRSSIHRLSEILQRVKNRVHNIENERLTGTHTAECSRKDLVEVAQLLGDQSTWHDSSFLEKKAIVKQQFGLSGRKFSAAVDAIRGSRALAAMVGIETDLQHLNDDKAIDVLNLWTIAHPVQEPISDDSGTHYFDRDWDAVRENRRTTREVDEAVLRILTAKEFADLECLFYIGRNREPGEHYDEFVERSIGSKHGDLTLDAVHNLMSKTNLLDSVIAGAAAVGRPTLSAKLRAIRPRSA